MKIEIETIYDGYNYGCFLQAFAMQSFLRKNGHQVVIVDHSNLKERVKRYYFAKSIKRTILKLRRFNIFSKSWKVLSVERNKQLKNIDATIIGSDEVWNIENPSFVHRPQFYGIGCKGNKVVAYGPSIGYSSPESYHHHKDFTNGIKFKIDHYLVRDKFTERFLNNLGINNIKRVCDPTFLIYNSWDSLRQNYPICNDYLLYYSYQDDTPFKDYILRFAEENHLKVIVVGFDYKWCDKSLIVNPFQFLDLMARAKYIVTSTFHGTIFSIIFRRKFIVIHPNDKVIDLLEHLNMDKLANPGCSYGVFRSLLEDVYNDDVNFIIENDVKKSSLLLLNAIQK